MLRAINGSPLQGGRVPAVQERAARPLGIQAARYLVPSHTKHKGTCTVTHGWMPKSKGEGLSLPGGGGEGEGKQLVRPPRAMK